MSGYEQLSVLCRANLEVTQRIEALALEAGARVWLMQMEAAQELLQNTTELSRVVATCLPATGQSLIGAWLSAAKGGHEVSAVTERHRRKIAESQTSKAA